MKIGAVAINWLLIAHQTFHHLREPTGRNWFVTSSNFMDWDKFIPFCKGPCSDPKQLSVMPNRARWEGQTVISTKFDGFSKHSHLAKITFTSVWTPDNFKNFLCFCISLIHLLSEMKVEELLRSTEPQIPPAILKNERGIFNLFSPNNNLGFFWGNCVVYLDKGCY